MHWQEVSPPLIQGQALTKSYLRWTEIEEIAALSVIILHYKITVLEEPRYAHETVEERRKRVLAPQLHFTLMPTRVPVEFTPREGTNILAY